MALSPRAYLVHALLTLCDDALFAVAAIGRLDADALRALARRRSPALQAVARGAPSERIEQGDLWRIRLCAALAPIAPPRWMAMADVIEEGLSLEHGARGVRSWFTSKPSDKDVARVRTQGAFVVRALGTVLGATGALAPEARLQQRCLAAALGLPDDDQRALEGEEPAAPDALDIPPGLTPKLARALVRGAFFAAMTEGGDPRQEQAALVLGRRVGLPPEGVIAVAGEAMRAVESLRALGAPALDAIRYLLADDRDVAEAPAMILARMTLPSNQRPEALAAVGAWAQVTLAKRHSMDRRQRDAALALSWATALRTDPTYARRIDLAVRHDQVAADFGDATAGRDTRQAMEAFLEEELSELAPLVPTPPPAAPAPAPAPAPPALPAPP